ncbi:MAG: ATP-binding protein [bacterium]|nr:ATP-binding protein [bacterium]
MDRRGRFGLYAAAIVVLGMGALLGLTFATPRTAVGPLLTLGLLVALAELGQVVLWPGHGASLGAGVALAAGWLFGPAGAGGVQLVGGVLAGLVARATPRVLLPNVSMYVSSAIVAATATGLLAEACAGAEPVRWLVFALGPVLFFATNSLLLSVGLAVLGGTRLLSTWHDTMRASVPQAIACGVVSVGLVYAHELAGMTGMVVLCLLAVEVNRVLMRRYASSMREREVAGLLGAVQASDVRHRRGHSRRVLRYAMALGQAMRVARADLDRLRHAALLHDIGLAGELMELVSQPRRLTGEELSLVQQHATRGADMIARIAALRDVADLMRHHHERLDGRGYPAGLAGEQIPLTVRILCVANAFDAMTTRRPHQAALTVRQALAELEDKQGSQFCPLVVREFVDLVRREDPARSHAFIQKIAGHEEEGEVSERLRRYIGRSRWAQVALDLQPQPRLLRLLLERWGLACQANWSTGLEWPRTLSEMVQVLGVSLELDEVLAFLCGMASRVTGRAAALLMADEAGERLQVLEIEPGPLKEAPELQGAVFDARSGLLGMALAGNRPLYSRDARTDPRSGRPNPFAPHGMRSLAVVPFQHRGSPVGVLLVWDNRTRPLPRGAVSLLTLVGREAALAVENARLLKLTRERLAEITAMKAFTDMVLEHVSTGILVVDGEGTVKLVNPEARRVLGDVRERTPVTQGAWGQLMLESIAGGRDRSARNMRTDGGKVLDVRCSPLRDPQGRVTGAVALINDVTERDRLEAQFMQAEKLALVGELAAGAAHEIRNPLTCIRGFIQLLKVPAPAGDLPAQYLDIVLGEIDRIEHIVRDLLQLARPPELNLGPADLNALAKEACLLFMTEAVRRGVSLSQQLHPALPLVRADSNLIKQVFLNIIGNALEAVDSGGRVEVVGEHLAAKGWVVFRVRDNGPGVPPEIRERIFHPFFTTRPQGTGLGLSVSHGIVRNHGGHIEVGSSSTGGAEFSVFLPVAGPEQPEVITPGS